MTGKKATNPGAKSKDHRPQSIRWDQRLKELKAFRDQHGHCNVPSKYPPHQPLAAWVHNVRTTKRQGKLAKERVRSLNAIGFCWALKKRAVYRNDWDEMMKALAVFKERHGHCDVPEAYRENLQLYWYLSHLRSKKRAGRLDRRQIKQLEKAGLTWEPLQQRWQEMYAALVAYQKEHGDVNVPKHWPPHPRLGVWVHSLRSMHKCHKLKRDRIEKLNALGFVWNVPEAQWEAMYAALVEFERKHGHCKVSTMSKTRLGAWVKTQREVRKQGIMPEKRVRRLDMLGFTWEVHIWKNRGPGKKS